MRQADLIDILVELSNASRSIMNDSDLKSIIGKYNMVFMGPNASQISSSELHNCIKEHFGIDISFQDFDSMLPTACKASGMHCEDLRLRKNPSKHADYLITLW